VSGTVKVIRSIIKLEDSVDKWQRVEITVALADRQAQTIWWAFIPFILRSQPLQIKISFKRQKGEFGTARLICYNGVELGKCGEVEERGEEDERLKTVGLSRRASRLHGIMPPPQPRT